MLAGSGRTTLHVRNSGTRRVAVDVSRAGFRLDLRGRPRIVWNGGARSAAAWLTLQPTHFTIGPRSTASLVVTSKLPRKAEPGDHDALALLATRPVSSGRVGVRLRLGVVVVVRAPGQIVRRLELQSAPCGAPPRAAECAGVGRRQPGKRDRAAAGSPCGSLEGEGRSSGRPGVSAESRPAAQNARNRRVPLPPDAARVDDRTRRHPGGRKSEASAADLPDQAVITSRSSAARASRGRRRSPPARPQRASSRT